MKRGNNSRISQGKNGTWYTTTREDVRKIPDVLREYLMPREEIFKTQQ